MIRHLRHLHNFNHFTCFCCSVIIKSCRIDVCYLLIKSTLRDADFTNLLKQTVEIFYCKYGTTIFQTLIIHNPGVFASGGARAVEQYLSIENLSHKTASDAFIAITDFICPDGGPQDEGIARSAYISAIEESPEIATIKFEDLTSEQIMVIVERTMANAIFNRITNDIGNKIILLPQERAISDRLIVQMKDFVKGSVSDAVINLDIKAGNIRQGDSLRIVDRVYKAAFEIMESAGENE